MSAKPRVELHGFIVSPPLRANMMTCEALGIEYDFKIVNAAKLEHLKPEYLRLNPIHSIPTMVDGDYVLFDSHAISSYLANMYGKEDKWYPKDPRVRGIVDQRLYFNCSVLLPSVKELGKPLLLGKQPCPKDAEKLREAMRDLEKLLGDKQFIACDWPTIADCHCSATVISALAIIPDAETGPLAKWLDRCKQDLPGFLKVNGPASEQMRMMKSSITVKL